MYYVFQKAWSQGYKTFLMLNSAEYDMYHAQKCKIVGILTFISMISTPSESLKARKVIIFQNFSFYEQLKFHTQLC